MVGDLEYNPGKLLSVIRIWTVQSCIVNGKGKSEESCKLGRRKK